MNEVKYVELFAGIGGFRKGIEDAEEKIKNVYCKNRTIKSTSSQCNLQRRRNSTDINGTEWRKDKSVYTCVYANEWNKYASSIYRYHYGECDTRDITTIGTNEIPDHDLLTGGFPCQAFSIAGKRKGFNDTRGTLFFEIARILEAKRTKYFILENVKGLLSHDTGKTFQTILAILDELGYDLQWQVLNSKNFGVPQNRERMFIVGHLRGERRPEIFPIRKDDSWCNEKPFPRQKTTKQKQSMQYIESWGRPKVYIRRLTPIEYERLQGFPDNYTKYGKDINGNVINISDSQRYACLGNAVTTNVISYIAYKFITSINNNDRFV